MAVSLPLDSAKARAAIKSVADPLGISVEQAAYGMFTIVNNNMVNGIRRVSVERGFDPRDFVLVGAGGATAAHITSLAARNGGRDDHPAEVGVRSVRFRPDHFGREIQFHGDACPVRLDHAKAYATINKLYKHIEAKGVKHLLSDGLLARADRHPAQHRHALCRTDA